MVLEYDVQLMYLLRYAPHMNTENFKFKNFLFGLNSNDRVKVRILMPHMLHDAV
jgi:hypothetical protein